MNWVTVLLVLTVTSGVMKMASAVVGGSSLLLVGVDWIPWVVNADDTRGMEHGEPLYDVLGESGGVE